MSKASFLDTMFGRPKKPNKSSKLDAAAAVLQSRIANLDVQAGALSNISTAAETAARRAQRARPGDIEARRHFEQHRATKAQFLQVVSARNALQQQLIALQAKALAQSNLEALTAAQSALGASNADVIDQLADALDELSTDAPAELTAVYSASLPDTDADFEAFLQEGNISAEPPLESPTELPMSPPTEAPVHRTAPNRAAAWME